MNDQVMKIHPGSVAAQVPHSAIVYDELVWIYFHLKANADPNLFFQIFTTQTYARGVSVVTKAEISSVFSSISNKF